MGCDGVEEAAYIFFFSFGFVAYAANKHSTQGQCRLALSCQTAAAVGVLEAGSLESSALYSVPANM